MTGHVRLLSERDVTYLALEWPKLLVKGAYVTQEALIHRILFRAYVALEAFNAKMDIPVVKIKGQLSQEILLAFVALLQLTRPVSSDIVQLEVEDLVEALVAGQTH